MVLDHQGDSEILHNPAELWAAEQEASCLIHSVSVCLFYVVGAGLNGRVLVLLQNCEELFAPRLVASCRRSWGQRW